jgi:hypothetical protein
MKIIFAYFMRYGDPVSPLPDSVRQAAEDSGRGSQTKKSLNFHPGTFELAEGLEPPTCALQVRCSTTELCQLIFALISKENKYRNLCKFLQ